MAPLPDFYRPRTPPRQHQREALELGWSWPGYGLLLEMGLGKSRVIIDNFCLLHEADKCDALLIVAAKDVYSNWTRVSDERPGELQKWMWDSVLPGTTVYTWDSKKTKREAGHTAAMLDVSVPGARVVAINIEALSSTDRAVEFCRLFMKRYRTMIAIDESTLIKNPKSIRTKTMLRLAPLAAYRRIATGTPITKSPTDAFTQFEFLAPGQRPLGHRNFVTFRTEFCVLREIFVGSRKIMKEEGGKNLDELGRRMAKMSFRRLKIDCLDLPPKIYVEPRVVHLTEEQESAYREMKRKAMLELKGGNVTTSIVMTQIMRLQQIVYGHTKTDEGRVIRFDQNRTKVLLEVIAENDDTTQGIIWCAFREDVSAVKRTLEEEYGEGCCAEWHGGVTQQEKETGEEEFQAGRRRFMLSTQRAGARGRTWTAASLVVYYSQVDDAELRAQSEDRPHRDGQTKAVAYVDLVTPGTVDENIPKSLHGKFSLAAAIINDGAEQWL